MNSEKTKTITAEPSKSTKRRTRSRKHRKRRTNSELSHEEGANENTAASEEDKLTESVTHDNTVEEQAASSSSLSLENKYINAGVERKRKTGAGSHEAGSNEDENIHPAKIPKGNMTSETEDNVSVKDVDMNSELEDNTSLTKDAHECNGKKDSVEKNQRSSCHCSVVERQEREIVNLKRKLQERDVYGASASSESENRKVSNESVEKFGAVEGKLNKMLSVMEEQRKKPPSMQTVESLHHKVDTVVRLLSDVVENQKKNAKIIHQLQKANEAQAQKEQEEMEKLKKTRFSASLPSNLTAIASKDSGSSLKPEDVKLKSAIFSEKTSKDEMPDGIRTASGPVQPPLPSDPLEQLRWGENMVLVGDTFWRSFHRLDDVKNVVDKMEKAVRFRINAGRDNEVIKRLYDTNREKLLFALPPKVKTIGISIGATDILEAKSEHIKTLKEGPLAEVKRHNLPTLKYMAKGVKEMIKKLLAMDKLVLLLIPLYGSQRREVFDQWQAVLKETMEDLPFPSFRMLNLQSLMKSTMAQFASPEQMFDTWLSNTSTLSLSAYGTRRLFDALKKAMWANNKKSLESGAYLNNAGPSLMQQKCPRCARPHPGGADACKSRFMICKVCGKLGHFNVIHDVTDLAFRQRIIDALGEDIFFLPSSQVEEAIDASNPLNDGNIPMNDINSGIGNKTNPTSGKKDSREHMQGPFTEKEMLERNSAQAVLPWNPSSKLDDWYN